MAKKAVAVKTSKTVKSTRSKLNKVPKQVKSPKLSAAKIGKTKTVKKTVGKTIKRKNEKISLKSKVRKAPKAVKIAKVPPKAKVVVKAKPQRVTKKNTEGSGPKGYTPTEYAKFLSEKKRLEGKTNQELKDQLRKNMQSMSGNKDDLIFKVADGIVLGRIPRCPKCFGGRPKFDYKKGTYYCSGYRDDQDFKNCHSTFQLGELKRDHWE